MAAQMKILLALVPFLFILFRLQAAKAGATYNVQGFGARSDGKSDCTRAFLNAWAAACASAQPSTVYVPPGRYLIGSAAFWGQTCRSRHITMQIDGTLVAPSDYNVLGPTGNWLKFESVNGLTILGGTIDGQGGGLWNCKNRGRNCPVGATSLGIYNSNNVMVNGLRSINSQLFHIIVDGCRNTNFIGLTISAPGDSPNTDGIHIQSSSDVTIMKSNIGTGDDCISIGPGCSNLRIQDSKCGPGHGISIGSLGSNFEEPGVQNVTVTSVTFVGTQNGVRIKTWAKPSTGFVREVLYQHLTMENVENPIIIDQRYCPSGGGCPNSAASIKISDVTYQDIHGTSATPVAVNFECSKKNPCTGISLQDVLLSYYNQPAVSSCVNAGGSSNGLVEPASCF